MLFRIVFGGVKELEDLYHHVEPAVSGHALTLPAAWHRSGGIGHWLIHIVGESRRMQHPLSKEIKPCTAIRLALEQFEPVNVSLNSTVVPSHA